MVVAERVLALHDAANSAGHGSGTPAPTPCSPLEELILEQHGANFALWHEEDRARDEDAADFTIAAVKRSIDALNQRRNDLMEQVDMALLQEAEQAADAELHSETPGMIIDRLSILSLKLFHSNEEAARTDANESHRQRNRQRVTILTEQRNDLASALNALWKGVVSGERRFKLYKQMKMYNDPSLNPVLYRRKAAEQG